MKKIQLFSGVVLFLLLAPMFGLSQANTKLSNLVSPTAINQHLQPGINNRYYIGSSVKRWRQGFFYDKISIRPSTNTAHFPVYPLDIVNTSYSRGISVINSFTGNSDRIGTYSRSRNNPGYGYGIQAYGGFYGTYSIGEGGNYTGSVIGVYGGATGVSSFCYGQRYGVYGYASGGASNYGVYGTTFDNCGSAFNAAGYFLGDVYSNNYFSISDRKFKKGITAITNSLPQLMKLKPSAYQFNTTAFPKMKLTEGNQLGLIADEVKQVFPELVRETVSPATYNEDKTLVTPSEKFESVNYIGLIPVLIASVQEQQKTIVSLKEENVLLKAVIEEFKTRLTKLELNTPNTVSTATLTSAMIDQNSPNPFSEGTIINYFVPQGAGKAHVNIIDAEGRVVKSVQLTQRGKGQLMLQAGTLTPGTYQYALYIGGKVVQTKQMVVAR